MFDRTSGARRGRDPLHNVLGRFPIRVKGVAQRRLKMHYWSKGEAKGQGEDTIMMKAQRVPGGMARRLGRYSNYLDWVSTQRWKAQDHGNATGLHGGQGKSDSCKGSCYTCAPALPKLACLAPRNISRSCTHNTPSITLRSRRRHPRNEPVIFPTSLPAVQCRGLDLPYTRHTMRGDKDTGRNVQLLFDSTSGEEVEKGAGQRPSNQYVVQRGLLDRRLTSLQQTSGIICRTLSRRAPFTSRVTATSATGQYIARGCCFCASGAGPKSASWSASTCRCALRVSTCA
ncbi:hypothetical protein OPT61_g5032 [Boeremia exigua]|uniref:Uncharacterized protein n=1 Tax=Boeremia exigua TaxID=749465 RepID=A0ACC2IBV7_9PLEO|nr:hypothetical protein OPT61_g5032 [Boeremia exigua]